MNALSLAQAAFFFSNKEQQHKYILVPYRHCKKTGFNMDGKKYVIIVLHDEAVLCFVEIRYNYPPPSMIVELGVELFVAMG